MNPPSLQSLLDSAQRHSSLGEYLDSKMHKCQEKTLGCGHTTAQQALKLTFLIIIPLNCFTHTRSTHEIFPIHFSHLYYLLFHSAQRQLLHHQCLIKDELTVSLSFFIFLYAELVIFDSLFLRLNAVHMHKHTNLFFRLSFMPSTYPFRDIVT